VFTRFRAKDSKKWSSVDSICHPPAQAALGKTFARIDCGAIH
jgi:hypothetical protein